MAGDLAMEPPLMPPQAMLTPLDLQHLAAGAASWPEVQNERCCWQSLWYLQCDACGAGPAAPRHWRRRLARGEM